MIADIGLFLLALFMFIIHYPIFTIFLLSMDSDLSAATFHCAKLVLVLFFMLER